MIRAILDNDSILDFTLTHPALWSSQDLKNFLKEKGFDLSKPIISHPQIEGQGMVFEQESPPVGNGSGKPLLGE